jgi:hypothetical protein
MGYVSRAKRYYSSGKRKFDRANKWSKTPQTPRALALQAYQGVKYLKGLVNSEMLHVVQSGSAALDQGASATVLHLTSIAQGDTVSGRTGNSVLLKGIQCRFEFVNSATSTPATLYRVMIVQDTQTTPDGTSLTTSDVLESNSTLAFMNLSTSGRYKILKNWYFTTDAVSRYSRSLTYYKPMHQHIRWNGTAAGDIQKNGIYLIAFSDQSTTSRPTMYYNIKLNYHDN